jgi:prepilin-type N-terminal cleavage/methylation domain-containing protein
MRKGGFTLIELLVVIAIIAILAAILFPVFARARDQAKKVQCLSNFSQGAKAIIMYADDNGNRCVPDNSWGFGSSNYGKWVDDSLHDMPWPENVQKYVRSWNVFRCPSDGGATDDAMAYDFSGAYVPPSKVALRHWAWAWRAHLGINGLWMSPNRATCNVKSGVVTQAMGGIGAPAKTILIIDSVWDRKASGAPFGGGNWRVDAPSWPAIGCYQGGWACWLSGDGNPDSATCRAMWNAWGGAYPWHSSMNAFNTAYCDTHARSNKVGELLAGVNPTNAQILDADAFQWDTYR